MRKLFFLIALAVLLVSSVNAQLSMNSTGAVTIGTSPTQGNSSPFLEIFGGRGNIWQRNFRVTYPNGFGLASTELAGLAEIGGSYTWVALYAKQGASSYAGYFDGNCYVKGNLYWTSDSILKENIKTIDNSLQRILKLKGVKYDFISDTLSTYEKTKEFKEKTRKDNLGFIAQDVQKITPELVIIDPASGNCAINYNGFIPLLVEALKEQQIIIESLQSEIQELKKDNNGNKLKSTKTTDGNTSFQSNTTNTLYQNAPNPFSQSTTIEYSIDENVQKAIICIYDMNGTQLKCFPLNFTGYGNITINGCELKAGMFMYSLIVDGQLIDTKRMVLTD